MPGLVKFLRKQRMLSPFLRRDNRGVGRVGQLSRVVLSGPELQLQQSSPPHPRQDPLLSPELMLVMIAALTHGPEQPL